MHIYYIYLICVCLEQLCITVLHDTTVVGASHITLIDICFLPQLSQLLTLLPLSPASPRLQDTPSLVTALSGKNVVFVAAGGSHSAAITEKGELYTWGKGSYGRLGHGELQLGDGRRLCAHVFTGMTHFSQVYVTHPDGCSGDTHTLALEDNDMMSSWCNA